MSADIDGKSWVELYEEEFGFDDPVEDRKYEETEIEIEEDIQKCVSPPTDQLNSGTLSAVDDTPTLLTKQQATDVEESERDTSVTDVTEDVHIKPDESEEKIISKFIKMEKNADVTTVKIKKEEEMMINELIKIETDDKTQQSECSSGMDDDDLDDMYLFMKQPVKQEVVDSTLSDTKVKTEPETDLNAEFKVEGAENEWGALIEPEEAQSSTKRLTFAQICAKNSSPAAAASVCVSNSNSLVSPSKKQRKRSLFPEKSDLKTEGFGILDENSVDSPCKDIRKIMTNIHMDSPLRSDVENIEGQRKIAVARRSNLMESLDSSSASNLRKRCRGPSKSSGSPAPKMPHYSDSPKANKDSKDIPTRKSKAFETDGATLARRQKQINYGKNTKGYDNYIKMVPKDKRESHHPKTPPKHLVYSRRGWDGLIKIWRQKLHFWDLPSEGGQGGIGVPDSWDSLSETSLSVTNSDEMSEKSLPTTPKVERRRVRKGSDISADAVGNSGN